MLNLGGQQRLRGAHRGSSMHINSRRCAQLVQMHWQRPQRASTMLPAAAKKPPSLSVFCLGRICGCGSRIHKGRISASLLSCERLGTPDQMSLWVQCVFGLEMGFIIQAKDTCNNKRSSGGDIFKASHPPPPPPGPLSPIPRHLCLRLFSARATQ